MTSADRPGGHSSERATAGYGYVLPAGGGGIARERAHWPERRGVAGLSLTVRFENLGGSAYVRCAGTGCGRQDRRLLAWPLMVGNKPAARDGGHFLQSNGRAAWTTMWAAFSSPGARRTILAFRTARWTATVCAAQGPPSTASGTGCAIAGRIWMSGRRSAGPLRRRRPIGSHPHEGR